MVPCIVVLHCIVLYQTHCVSFFFLASFFYFQLDYWGFDCRIHPFVCWKLGLCHGYGCQLDKKDDDGT
jgi:hypothetical protein